MRAFVIEKYAHPSDISLKTDAPEPKLGADDVLIDIYSAGLNLFDVSTVLNYPEETTSCIIVTSSARQIPSATSIPVHFRS